MLARELSLPSGRTSTSSAMTVPPLDLFMLLFTRFDTLSERERPRCADGRAANRSGGEKEKAKWSAMGTA